MQRAACRSHGILGNELSIQDDLSHGPLDDGRKRVDYMRACFQGYDDWLFDVTDAFAPWREVVEWLDEEKLYSTSCLAVATSVWLHLIDAM